MMSVEVTYHPPGKELNWLVKQYQLILFNGKTEVLDKFIPRSDVSLVFHFHTPPYMLAPQPGLLPLYFIAPIITQANLMRLSKKNETFIVTCKPSVFSRVFNLNLSPGTEIYLPLQDSKFDKLWKLLAAKKSMNERISQFEEFVSTYFPSTYIPDEIDLFYERILENGVFRTVMELTSTLSVSNRTIQRQFRSRVGVCPKTLLRIVRINHLWEKLKNNDPIDYQSLVFEGNYFDQTHFIKDFKALTGETPDYFFRRDLRHVKILSGKGS